MTTHPDEGQARMSDKLTCPGCDSRTSDVFRAVMNDEPCPYCGTPAAIVLRVDEVKKTRADEALRAELAETLAELGRVTGERDRLARIVENVREALGKDR